MARKARIEYPGAAYHIMSRGNRGADIFIDDDDRLLFLKALGEAAERCAWQIHAYVLMRNHYHLLLVTPNGNLVEGMKWMQGTFTQRINSRHRWRGHLFQGRYKAQNIDSNSSEGYFLTVANYIHLNPERANMIGEGRKWQQLRDYPWSSLPHYLSFKRQRPEWLHAADVLGRMQWKDTPKGRRGYAVQLESRVREEAQGNNGINSNDKADQSHPTKDQWCLGGDEFRDELMERIEALLKGVDKGSISGADVRETGERQAEKLIIRGMRLLKINNADLEQTKKNCPKKRTLAWLARSRTTASTRWIARRLLMGDPSNVSRSVGVIQNTKDKEVRRWKKQLLR
ncbi:MAG: transposase [Verrucomicrobiales bacterium]|nr:transposase [Verrucomicrobiales bacterium]